VAKYMDAAHISFGVVLSGRSFPIYGVDSVIGPTINTLPLCISLDKKQTIQEYLTTVFRSLLDLVSFQWSTPSQGYTRNFASAVNVSSFKTSVDPHAGEKDRYFEIQSDIPLQVDFEESGHVRLRYDTTTFQRPHMQRLGATLIKALNASSNSTASVGSILSSLYDKEEQIGLREMGNWASPATTIVSFWFHICCPFHRPFKSYMYEQQRLELQLEEGTRVDSGFLQ
jgi:non-ribosomal peptide synthetase component F